MSAKYDLSKCKTSLLSCLCGRDGIIKEKFDGLFFRLECNECNNNAWFVCGGCNRQRSRFTSTRQVKRHKNELGHRDPCGEPFNKRTKHTKNDNSDSDEENIFSCLPTDANDDLNMEESSLDEDSRDPELLDIPLYSTLGFDHCHSSQTFYQCRSFDQNPINSKLLGLQHLVEKQYSKVSVVSGLANDQISVEREQLELQLNIAELAYVIPSTYRGMLAKVFKGVLTSSPGDANQNSRSTNISPNTSSTINRYPIPTEPNHIRRMVQGKSSIIQNLPHPPIHTDVPGHAYVRVIDCLRDLLAQPNVKLQHVAEPNPSKNSVNYTSHSRRASTIYERAISQNSVIKTGSKKVYLLIFWSDDVDPGSSSMQGRASTWIKTMSLMGPPSDSNRVQNTYPIAIAEKGSCHDEIERLINKDLYHLGQLQTLSPFYLGNHQQLSHCSFSMSHILADQPERRSQNYFPLGNATYGARFGVSANHREIYPSLACCRACLAVLSQRFMEGQCSLPLPECQNCLLWDATNISNSLALTKPPKNFPTLIEGDENIPVELREHYKYVNGTLFVRPFVVSYETMKLAIITAHETFIHGDWNQENCESFFKVECLNTAIVDRFKVHAKACHDLANADGDILRKLQEDLAKHPDLYQRMPFPPQWDRTGFQLSHNVECIMHEIFLGIVKSVILLIQKTLKRRGCSPYFKREANSILEKLLGSTSDWMKVREYKGGKFAGFISENWLAYARILPWLYQTFDEIMPNKDVHEHRPKPDQQDPGKWNYKQRKYWLGSRGLCTSGKTDKLLIRIQSYFSKPQGEIPVELPIPSIATSEIELLITSLSEMLECIFAQSTNQSHIQKLDYAIRIFISAFDHIDQKLRKGKKGPKKISCINKYNFMCLMNLPGVISEMGPLRCLWEGKVQGEGYLPHVKKTYTAGMTRNKSWTKTMLHGLYIQKAFENLKIDEGKEITNPFIKHRTKHHAMSCHQEVFDILEEKKVKNKRALSFVLLLDKDTVRMFCVLKKLSREVSPGLVEFNLDSIIPPTTVFGRKYYKFSTREPEIGVDLNWEKDILPELSPDFEIEYGYLLPILSSDNHLACNKFHLICSNWRHLQGSSLLDLFFRD